MKSTITALEPWSRFIPHKPLFLLQKYRGETGIILLNKLSDKGSTRVLYELSDKGRY